VGLGYLNCAQFAKEWRNKDHARTRLAVETSRDQVPPAGPDVNAGRRRVSKCWPLHRDPIQGRRSRTAVFLRHFRRNRK